MLGTLESVFAGILCTHCISTEVRSSQSAQCLLLYLRGPTSGCFCKRFSHTNLHLAVLQSLKPQKQRAKIWSACPEKYNLIPSGLPLSGWLCTPASGLLNRAFLQTWILAGGAGKTLACGVPALRTSTKPYTLVLWRKRQFGKSAEPRSGVQGAFWTWEAGCLLPTQEKWRTRDS